MSDSAGDLMKRLLEAETANSLELSYARALFHDARLLLLNLSLAEVSAQNRAAELEKEGGVPESLCRIADALESLVNATPSVMSLIAELCQKR